MDIKDDLAKFLVENGLAEERHGYGHATGMMVAEELLLHFEIRRIDAPAPTSGDMRDSGEAGDGYIPAYLRDVPTKPCHKSRMESEHRRHPYVSGAADFQCAGYPPEAPTGS